jgi:hypothetical protein
MARKSVVCTLGADPEFFLLNTDTDKPMSAVGKIGGTKGKPVKISDGLKKGFGVQEDNVMVEFNIPVAKNSENFGTFVNEAMEALTVRIKDSLGLHINPLIKASVEFPNSELQSDQAMTFGCSPDFDAHLKGLEFGRISPDVLRTTKGAWRMAGGHVHLGYSLAIPPFVAAAFADLFLGLPSIPYDKQGLRRKYYGQAGRYRPTPYGIEYRTLSNYWITQHAHHIGMYAEQMIHYLSVRNVAELRAKYASIPWTAVQECINNENDAVALDLHQFCMHEIGYSDEG